MNKEKIKFILQNIENNFKKLISEEDDEKIDYLKEKLIDNQNKLNDELEKIENFVETENQKKENKLNEPIDQHKNIKINQGKFKILFLISSIFILSTIGIYIYQSIPKSVKSENIEVADPNNFRIEDLGDNDEKILKKEIIKEKNEVKTELELPKVETLNEVSEPEEYDNDQSEIDRSIAELEGKEIVVNKSTNSNNGLSYINRFNKDKVEKEDNNKIKSKEKENDNHYNKDLRIINKIIDSEKYVINQGSILPAILLTEMNTDLPGAILAQIREDVYDTATGNHILIPKGSKLYGRYESNIAKGQNRVFAVWDKLVLPNGKYVNLSEMQTADALGNSGLKDKVDNHILSLVGKTILSSVLNLGDTLASGVSFNVGKFNIGLSGQSKEKERESSFRKATGKLVSDEGNRQPTITVRRGYKFNVIVNGDLFLEKYGE